MKTKILLLLSALIFIAPAWAADAMPEPSSSASASQEAQPAQKHAAKKHKKKKTEKKAAAAAPATANTCYLQTCGGIPGCYQAKCGAVCQTC